MCPLFSSQHRMTMPSQGARHLRGDVDGARWALFSCRSDDERHFSSRSLLAGKPAARGVEGAGVTSHRVIERANRTRAPSRPSVAEWSTMIWRSAPRQSSPTQPYLQLQTHAVNLAPIVTHPFAVAVVAGATRGVRASRGIWRTGAT